MQRAAGTAWTSLRWGLLGIALVAVGYALLVQPLGCTQTSHYALVRSLADGTATIDAYHWETCDKGWTNGHFYANKAPGLAFLTLPYYLALDGLGLVPENPRTAVWLLGLLGVVLPGALLLALVRRLADALERGTGTVVAVTAGLGTLLLPFSTLFFSHVLSALLGLAAFALLWREREGPPRLRLLAGAGLLAGLAVTTEYPLALVGVILGLYALARRGVVRRAAAYGAGALVGAAPLFLYNWWAFGSVTQLSYANTVVNEGQSGHDVVAADAGGFFGISAPSARVALELLFSARGLLTLAPVLAAGAAGAVLLFRRGRRAEALTIGVIAILFVTYNSGFFVPLGGDVPGPRYLIPLLPFLALPLALAYRVAPAATLALGGASALTMLAATSTEPMLGEDDTGRWVDLVREGDFTSTVVTLAGGGHGWAAIVPFLLVGVAAGGVALRSAAPGWPSRRDLETAAVALVGWGIVAGSTPSLLSTDRASGGVAGGLAVLALTAAVCAAVARVNAGGLRSLLAALPLAGFLAPALSEHTKWALLTALASLVSIAVAEYVRRTTAPRALETSASDRPPGDPSSASVQPTAAAAASGEPAPGGSKAGASERGT